MSQDCIIMLLYHLYMDTLLHPTVDVCDMIHELRTSLLLHGIFALSIKIYVSLWLTRRQRLNMGGRVVQS